MGTSYSLVFFFLKMMFLVNFRVGIYIKILEGKYCIFDWFRVGFLFFFL